MSLGGLWQDQDLVFPNDLGSLLNPSNLRNRSGVRADLRFHDLRHTCATMLLRAGVNVKVVSEMLGHASITITLDTYSHVLPDMQDWRPTLWKRLWAPCRDPSSARVAVRLQ